MYDTPLTLRSQHWSKDNAGNIDDTTTDKTVLCEVKSVRQSEFYQSMANGLKPELMVEIADYRDYNNEQLAVVGGVVYRVLRTYKKHTTLEIVLYGGVIEDGNA